MKNIFFKAVNDGKKTFTSVMILAVAALIALGSACGGTGSNTGSGGNSINGGASITPPAVRADASKAEMPSEEELQYMAKTTLLELNEAIQKGDFTDFHSRMSKSGQNLVSPEKLKQQFGIFIEKGIDLSSIKSEKAVFSPEPGISPGKLMKMLILQGSYDIKPTPATFELRYIAEDKEWKLYGIDVQIKKVQQ